jgi:hypothetical protein
MLRSPEDTQRDKLAALMPSFDMESDNKREYFSWRMFGFSRTDSIKRCGLSLTTVKRWLKDDESFAEFDSQSLQTLSDKYRKEALGLEYTRLIKLAMVSDERVLDKAAKNKPMTDNEWDYLKKIRPLYTPAALKILDDLIKGDSSSQAGSWDELLIIARRNTNASGGNHPIIDQDKILELSAYSSFTESK